MNHGDDIYERQPNLRRYESRLARLKNKLRRQQDGGSNWRKTRAQIDKVRAKIARVREHDRRNGGSG